jgi:hypothetical protein
MITTKKITKEIEVIDNVFCNKCGESCEPWVSDNGRATGHGLIEAKVSGGYSSPILPDGHSYCFSLCEKCLVELMKTFKHPAYRGCKHDTDCLDDPTMIPEEQPAPVEQATAPAPEAPRDAENWCNDSMCGGCHRQGHG